MAVSRVFGRKNYYMACVALFTVTSLLCGIAPTLGVMLMARVLQGIGGGGLAPVEQAILVDTFPPAKRASAFALYTVAIVTAPAIGPVLGGWITDNYNWRWVFLINIPIGIAVAVSDQPLCAGSRRRLRRSARRCATPTASCTSTASASRSIGVGSGALEMLLDRGQIDDWFGSPYICWMLRSSASAAWPRRSSGNCIMPDPVIDFRLLKIRNFAIANVFYFIFGFGLFASTTMIPQLLQSLYGYRAIDAGLVLGPGAFVITVLAPVGAQLVQRGIVKPKILLFGAVIVVGISFLHYSHFNLQTDYAHYAWRARCRGLAMRSSLCRSR